MGSSSKKSPARARASPRAKPKPRSPPKKGKGKRVRPASKPVAAAKTPAPKSPVSKVPTPAPTPPVAPTPPRSDARRHVLSLAFLRDGDEFLARLETDGGEITELKNRALDQLLMLVAGELEDLL
ncbi:MAG: hypothetical protein L3K13_07230 [Thermoplasmata archaeon]|nr:hypothetical protein [Thermoplasmata archaeon]